MRIQRKGKRTAKPVMRTLKGFSEPEPEPEPEASMSVTTEPMVVVDVDVESCSYVWESSRLLDSQCRKGAS
jgi:hypothetical protein